MDLDRLSYEGNFAARHINVSACWQGLSQTSFAGPGQFQRPDSEISSYVMDDWRLRENLQIEAGVRQDWDQLVQPDRRQPPFAVSWSPFASRNTKLSGGYAITYDATPLLLFARPLDQQSVTQNFTSDGTPSGSPLVTDIRGSLRAVEAATLQQLDGDHRPALRARFQCPHRLPLPQWRRRLHLRGLPVAPFRPGYPSTC